MAESHKTLQVNICDILFPCGDHATSDAQEKPRTGWGRGEVGVRICCVKKTCLELEGSTSTSKTEVTVRSCCKKQFEKKTLPKALKFSDCRERIRRQMQPSYKKILDLRKVFPLFGFLEVCKFRDSGVGQWVNEATRLEFSGFIDVI